MEFFGHCDEIAEVTQFHLMTDTWIVLVDLHIYIMITSFRYREG
jgi:hypothetical protein